MSAFWEKLRNEVAPILLHWACGLVLIVMFTALGALLFCSEFCLDALVRFLGLKHQPDSLNDFVVQLETIDRWFVLTVFCTTGVYSFLRVVRKMLTPVVDWFKKKPEAPSTYQQPSEL